MAKKIYIHWTAGQYVPNYDDYEHYHYMFGNGIKYNGKYTPEDNNNCTDGRYAAHTGGLNTNSIGVAICCNLGFDSKTKKTSFPLLKIDFEHLCEHVAVLAKKYNIPINGNFIMTHYEVGQKVKEQIIKRTPLTSANIGKIDIMYLPFYPSIKPADVGDFIRNKIIWYYEKM